MVSETVREVFKYDIFLNWNFNRNYTKYSDLSELSEQAFYKQENKLVLLFYFDYIESFSD